MELIIKEFSELTRDELFEIYKLRTQVFVVEQDCAYQEVDDWDKVSYHLWLRDEKGIQAYARLLPKGTTFPEVSIGRVIAVKRRKGLGTKIVKAAIDLAIEKFKADKITIEAQVYVKNMYENLGFVQTSEEFLDIGIPHIQMQWQRSEKLES